MTQSYLGIDIGKRKLHVALLFEGRGPKRKQFRNDASGHQALGQWLAGQRTSSVHVCLEATSTYGNGVAQYLHQQGHRVSIANPKAVKAYGESRMTRTKTDQADALVIAQYCRDIKPRHWSPSAPEVEQLQLLVRRLEALEEMIVAEKNRLETAPKELRGDIEAHIRFMEQQQADLWQQIDEHVEGHPHLKEQQALLDSIPGIGPKTAARILGELGHWQAFSSARELAAYAGITPQEKVSGSSVRGKPRLCKLGSARLRHQLFFPALTLLRWSPEICRWREELLKRGKTKKQVVGAVMHKVIRWVFGVLHSGKPFDPAIAFPNHPA